MYRVPHGYQQPVPTQLHGPAAKPRKDEDGPEDPYVNHYMAHTPLSQQMSATQKPSGKKHGGAFQPKFANQKSHPAHYGQALSRPSVNNSHAITFKEHDQRKDSLSICSMSDRPEGVHRHPAHQKGQQEGRDEGKVEINLKSPAEHSHLKVMNMVLTPMNDNQSNLTGAANQGFMSLNFWRDQRN